MSQWTHVAGIIRIDGLFIPGVDEKIPNLGNTCQFEDDESVWGLCDVPCGSEGSLYTSLYINPDTSMLARYVATIWGDLRDWGSVAGDTEVIVDYFNRIVKGHVVRGGCFTVDVEGQAIFTYIYDADKEKFTCVAQINSQIP